MNIGLTQRVLYHRNRAYDSIEHAWYQFLDSHGLTFISNTLDQDFTQLADNLDCLIITGGDDSKLRRTCELKLASAMIMQQKPVLGICHGAFLLTDVLGGRVQDVDDHLDTEHTVRYHDREITVNSFHNLGIVQPHSSATTLAWDDSGRTEAWIDGNIAGIVWHPERMAEPFIPSEIQTIMRL